MKQLSIFLLLCVGVLVSSCGPSEEEILAAADKAAVEFFQSVTFAKPEKVKEMYPDFEKLGMELTDIKFDKTESGVSVNNGDETYSASVRLIPRRGDAKIVSFTMKPVVCKKDNIQFQILDSRGLSKWSNDKMAMAFGCWKESDMLTDAEYYERYQIAQKICEEGAKTVAPEVEKSITITSGYAKYPAYKITNKSKYSVKNIYLAITFKGKKNSRYFQGDKVETVKEDWEEIDMIPGKSYGAFSSSGYSWDIHKVVSVKVKISDKQARNLFVRHATGSEYAEYMKAQGVQQQ